MTINANYEMRGNSLNYAKTPPKPKNLLRRTKSGFDPKLDGMGTRVNREVSTVVFASQKNGHGNTANPSDIVEFGQRIAGCYDRHLENLGDQIVQNAAEKARMRLKEQQKSNVKQMGAVTKVAVAVIGTIGALAYSFRCFI